MMKKLLMSSFLAVLMGHSAVSLAATPFKIKGQPVHPACLGIFNRFSATLNYVSRINLDQCQLRQNALNPNPTRDAKNWLVVNFPAKYGGGFYRYKVIGQTLNGIYVIDTINNTGGHQEFEGVLLLRKNNIKEQEWNVEKQKFIPHWHTTLEVVSRIAGGDRADGSLHSLKVFGNTIKGMKYSDQNDPTKPQHPDRKIEADVSDL